MKKNSDFVGCKKIREQSYLKISCSLALMVCQVALAGEYAVHPNPTKPVYISEARYAHFKSRLMPMPAKESAEQKKDEATLLQFQQTRSEKDCAAASSEVRVTLETFYGPNTHILDAATVNKWAPLFEQIRNDSNYFIQKLKSEVPRLRPFLYMKELTPCIAKESTKAYPSGHATIAQIYALVLSELDPARREIFLKRAQEIGQHRILGGVHHPSDVEAGRRLANELFKEFQKSPEFQKRIAAFKPSF